MKAHYNWPLVLERHQGDAGEAALGRRALALCLELDGASGELESIHDSVNR